MPDLMRRLADDPASDPLVGNYTLVKQQDIILAFQGLQNQYGMMAFTASSGGTTPTLSPTGTILQGDQTPGKHLAAACGDFDGDGLDEIATVYNDAGELTLVMAKNQDPADSASLSIVSSTPIAPFASGLVRVSAGSLTGAPQDTITIAWVDANSALNLQVWEVDEALTPSLVASGAPVTVTGTQWDLIGGAFDDTDTSGVAIVWEGPADAHGNTLFLTVCGLDTTSDANQIVASAPASLGVLGGSHACCVAAGPFVAASTQEQIAVAWSDDSDYVHLQMCQGQGLSAPTPSGTPYVDTANPLTDSRIIRLAAGDLDLDGVDEIVLGSVGQKNGYQAAAVLRVIKTDNLLNPSVISLGVTGVVNQAMASVDLQLAIGQIGAGGFLGIIVSSLGTVGVIEPLEGISRLYLGLVPVSPTLQLPPAMVNGVAAPYSLLTYDQAHDPNLDLTLGLALGDFSGASLRVGPPTESSFSIVNNILAIINAPPLQAGVNYDGGSSVSFSNAQNQNTAVGVMVSKDWMTSDSIAVNLDLAGILALNGSLMRTYGSNFNKTEDSSKAFAQTVSTTLWQDDLILLSGTQYTVWEYPVFDDASGTAKGYLMVAFPNVDGPQTLQFFGTSQFIDYMPDHETGTLLSYSSVPPADYVQGTAINLPISLNIAAGQTTMTVDWAESNTASESTTSQVSTSINAGVNVSKTFNFLAGVGIGINAHFNDTYSESRMDNYAVTYGETTSVTFSFSALSDRTAEYLVQPYIYFSNEGGFLVVDYAVTIPSTGYWAANFNHPSASFNQPWKDGQDPSLWYYTHSIQFVVQQDGTLLVTARVANYSLVPTHDVQVAFYQGPPNDPDPRLLGQSTIPTIPPRGRVNNSVLWTPPSEPGAYQIWVTLAPTNGSSVFPPTQGYGVWTVNA